MLRFTVLSCIAAAVLDLLCAGLPAYAVTPQTVVPAASAAKPPSTDPSLMDPAWKPGAIPQPGGFFDLTTRRTAPHRTDVCLLYDAQNLYVAFHSEQRGTAIVGEQTTNDVGFGSDDFVGIGIDTSGAGSDVYYFETTPRAARYAQANENSRYRPTWLSTARILDGSWNAVLVIPLNVLRIHGGSPQTWRINFIRNVASSGEHYTWSYDGLMQDGQIGNGWPNFMDQRFWAKWSGIRLASNRLSRPKPRADVYALGSVGRDRNLFQQANGQFLAEKDRPAGLDVSIPLTSTINFVGTAAPDFSNVEIDQQTIAPQEFARQLVEYRPFFAQGANFINANAAAINPNLVFYSPSIGPFNAGEKVEGTSGDQSFGVLHFNGFSQVTQTSFDDIAYGFKHALPDRTFLYWMDGVLAHHGAQGNDATTEFGAAGRNLQSGLVYAFDDAIERGSWLSNGIAHNTNGFLDVHKPNYEILTAYQDISPTYNPIDGYTAAADERGLYASLNLIGATPFIKNQDLYVQGDRYVDAAGAVHQADFFAFYNAAFKNGFSIDGAGPQVSELRSYAAQDPRGSSLSCASNSLSRTTYSGYPGYFCGRNDTYNLLTIPVGYGDGTPAPIDVSASFGRFGYGLLGIRDNGPDYVHLYTSSTSRSLNKMFSLGLEYDGTVERGIRSGILDSQWLRRVTLGVRLGADESFTVSLRDINGSGGFAVPGLNLAAGYHRRFRNGDELFLNFGTPAANYTLDRTILKYVFHVGADAGT